MISSLTKSLIIIQYTKKVKCPCYCLHIKHCELEQYNDRAALATKNYKDFGGRVRLSFQWDAFSMEVMVWKKTVSSNFGRAADTCR
jgi:hypothetical protein